MVSLAVLGLIAGLTVPSIVTSVEKSKRKVIFKESLSSLADVLTNQRNLGFDAWNTPTEYWGNIKNSLNATLSMSEFWNEYWTGTNGPCKPTTNCHAWDYVYKQANGSYIGFTTGGSSESDYVIHSFIDVNGKTPPNIAGQDILQVSFPLKKGKIESSSPVYGVHPYERNTPNNDLYNSLF